MTPIRLIGADGAQIGVIPTSEALARARETGLDLVEVSPNAKPPVCRILDYGKYKYNLSKKAADAKKKQHTINIKGMRYRPKTEEHDYQFKLKHVRTFLEEGHKVKCFVLFRGRERAHTDFGRRILDRLIEDLGDIAIIENRPKMEGYSMTMLVAPINMPMKKKEGSKKSRKSRDRKARQAETDAVAVDELGTEMEDDVEEVIEFDDDDGLGGEMEDSDKET